MAVVIMARRKSSAGSRARVAKDDATRKPVWDSEQSASGYKSRSSLRSLEWFLERTGKSDFVLAGAFVKWKETHNPYFVWMAIEACTRERVGFPDWVCKYLAECATRMLSPQAEDASDLRKILPEIMGFSSTKGRGRYPLAPDDDNWRYLGAAMRFAVEIFKGAQPTAALSSAFDVLDFEVADRMDDKTLRNHIKKFFGMTVAPRTNAAWEQALRDYATSAFG
jgi:hypothetical protein